MSLIPEYTNELKAKNILKNIIARLHQDLDPPAGTTTVATCLGNQKENFSSDEINDILLAIVEHTLTDVRLENWGNNGIARHISAEIFTTTKDHSYHVTPITTSRCRIEKSNNVQDVPGSVISYIAGFTSPCVEKYIVEAMKKEGINPPKLNFMFRRLIRKIS